MTDAAPGRAAEDSSVTQASDIGEAQGSIDELAQKP